MSEDTYRAYAVNYNHPDSSINYEITIQGPGGIIGHTQAETADDVELMTRDYLDTMGHDGDAPSTSSGLTAATPNDSHVLC